MKTLILPYILSLAIGIQFLHGSAETENNYFSSALTTTGISDGVYYSTDKEVVKFELTNCCSDGPITCKMFFKNKSYDKTVTFKKSSYVLGLFYDPRANGNHYLFVDKESNLIYDFMAKELYDTDTKYTITGVWILGMDESVKTKNGEELRPKAEAILKELFDKKRGEQKKEEQQKLQSVYLPKSQMNNTALQSKVLNELNKVSAEKKWGDSFSKVIITCADWGVVKNKATGAIIKRNLDVVAVMTNPSSPGKCFFVEHRFSQQYTGSSYSSALTYEGIGTTTEILCDRTK